MGKIKISVETARHYFWEWQNRPAKFNTKYAFCRKETINQPKLRQRLIADCAASLNMSEDEVTNWLEKPWGLHQIMTGKLRKEAEYLQAANEIKRFIAADRLLKYLDGFNFTIEEQALLLVAALHEASRQRKNKRDAK